MMEENAGGVEWHRVRRDARRLGNTESQIHLKSGRQISILWKILGLNNVIGKHALDGFAPSTNDRRFCVFVIYNEKHRPRSRCEKRPDSTLKSHERSLARSTQSTDIQINRPRHDDAAA